MRKLTGRFIAEFEKLGAHERRKVILELFGFLEGYCDGLIGDDEQPHPDLIHARKSLAAMMTDAGIVAGTKAVPS